MKAFAPPSGSSSTAGVNLEFHVATITSDAGLLAARELDEGLGLTEMATGHVKERRTGRNVQHPLVPLLRRSRYSRLAGYEDTKQDCTAEVVGRGSLGDVRPVEGPPGRRVGQNDDRPC